MHFFFHPNFASSIPNILEFARVKTPPRWLNGLLGGEESCKILKDGYIIDGSGSREFKRQLKTYLRKKIGTSIVKKVKIQSSRNNNLIQLADMIAGAIHRNFTNKGDKEIYRKIIKTREIYVQIWPK